jgi:hypothetical protein
MSCTDLLMHPRPFFQVLVLLCAMAAFAVAQNPTPVQPGNVSGQQEQPPPLQALSPLPQDATAYVRQAIQHELAEQDRDHTHWRYQLHREDEKNSYDRDVIETSDGNISRTLLWNGQPLTPELRDKDNERINKLLHDPGERAKHIKREKEDGEKARQMLNAVPDAFVFRYDGEEDGRVRLAFTPNPHYDAPNRELQVFRALSGKLWIDRATNRLAGIDGALFEDVTFGFGLLGRLNKGGTFKVLQRQVGPNHWEVVSLEVNMSGHAIVFKNINVRQRQKLTDFRRMPDSLTLPQAYQMLQSDPHSVSAANAQADHRIAGKD